jgi:hypothetical protein
LPGTRDDTLRARRRERDLRGAPLEARVRYQAPLARYRTERGGGTGRVRLGAGRGAGGAAAGDGGAGSGSTCLRGRGLSLSTSYARGGTTGVSELNHDDLMSTLTTIFVCVPTIKRSLIHSWLSISRPYFLLNHKRTGASLLGLRPEEDQ